MGIVQKHEWEFRLKDGNCRQRGNFPGDRISCRIQTEISLLLLQTCM